MLTTQQIQALESTIRNTNILTDEAKNMLLHILEAGEPLSEDFREAISLLLDIEDEIIEKKIHILEKEIADIEKQQTLAEREYQEKEEEIREKLPPLMEEEAQKAIEEIKNIHLEYDTKAEEMIVSVEKSQEEAIRASLLQK